MTTRTGPRAAAALVLALAAGLVAAATPATGSAVRQCTNSDLVASYRPGDSAAGHRYGRILLTNTSRSSCFVRGYGGLSYVGGGDGTQIGAAADRTPAPLARYVLRPGQHVHSAVDETSYAPFPRRKCRPRHVDGFRVYVPDATKSQFVPHPTTGCANEAVHLLSHKPYRR